MTIGLAAPGTGAALAGQVSDEAAELQRRRKQQQQLTGLGLSPASSSVLGIGAGNAAGVGTF
jgi:hypothetical protein